MPQLPLRAGPGLPNEGSSCRCDGTGTVARTTALPRICVPVGSRGSKVLVVPTMDPRRLQLGGVCKLRAIAS